MRYENSKIVDGHGDWRPPWYLPYKMLTFQYNCISNDKHRLAFFLLTDMGTGISVRNGENTIGAYQNFDYGLGSFFMLYIFENDFFLTFTDVLSSKCKPKFKHGAYFP